MIELAKRLALAMAGPPETKPADLARACGVRPPSVSDWLSGKTKKLEGANLLAAAEHLRVNPWWLATGRGEMREPYMAGYTRAPGVDTSLPDTETLLTPSSRHIEVPLFDARGSMGMGYALPEHDTIIERISVSPEWVRDALPSLTSIKQLALMRGYGDSMEGTFNDGDILWIDRGVTDVKTDAVYVLALHDELYVKRLQRRPDGSILMISDNKKYEPYLIENGDRDKFRVLGRVVYAWRGTRV